MTYIRPSSHVRFMRTAFIQSEGGTCVRRRVGCVLINKHKHIIGTGYNGPASGEPHCIDSPCPGANLPSGTGLSTCEAIHAEANALLQCRDIREIFAAYVTVSPCLDCIKLFLNTSCKIIYFVGAYSHHGEAIKLWERGGDRKLVQLPNCGEFNEWLK